MFDRAASAMPDTESSDAADGLDPAAVLTREALGPVTPDPLPIAPVAGPHPYFDSTPGAWVDEQIWGHRLWDAQSPWLTFLEFLTVAEAQHRAGTLLKGGGAYPLAFRPHQRMYLRNVLFNSDDPVRVAATQPDDRTAWAAWLASTAERARGVPRRDFSYLVPRFHSFHEFAHVVALLRGAVVESESNKRWSSRFVFPFGPRSIYEDVNVKEGAANPSREYIYFGRTGELLYLMMSRARGHAELAPVLADAVSVTGAGAGRWDRMVGLLQPEGEGEDGQSRGRSYLPYAAHPTFDALADDWLAVARLGLPGYDAYPHWVALGGLHLVRYLLAVAAVWAGQPAPATGPAMVCEIVAPRRTPVRERALASYAQNDALSTRAVEAFVRRVCESDAWREAAAADAPFPRCRAVLAQFTWWGDDYTGPSEPDALATAFRRFALDRHRQHVAHVHRTFGRDVGLVSRRGTTRFRYAPTDALLKTLLLANVQRRLEFGEFLARLFTRYGLVIGDREAERVLPPEEFERKAFKANARRLEERLASLGLLRRLSDACAYVENPYATGGDRDDGPADGRSGGDGVAAAVSALANAGAASPEALA